MMKNNLTILLIDDDEDDRNLFKESVKQVDAAINCLLMSDCLHALDYLRNIENPAPDYIFLDLRMPGYSGRQCLVEIKSNAYGSGHIPVIVYTTSADVDDSEGMKKMGASHFISKPTDPAEIYYMVSQVINEKWT